jgi:hypothetical protein
MLRAQPLCTGQISSSGGSHGHLIFCGSARACGGGGGPASEAARQLSLALARFAPHSSRGPSGPGGGDFVPGHVVELRVADLLPPAAVARASGSSGLQRTGTVAAAAAVAAAKAALHRARGGVLLVLDAGRLASKGGPRTDAQAALAAELERAMAESAAAAVVALVVGPAEMQAFVGGARDLAQRVGHVVHFAD